MGWAAFWAIFHTKHPVTLPPSSTSIIFSTFVLSNCLAADVADFTELVDSEVHVLQFH
jgi:hypothetical protein